MDYPRALTGGDRRIDDELVSSSAPAVRALMVERLEAVWRACEPHFTNPDSKPDPRYIEAAIRVVDRMSRLYRLDTPAVGGNDAVQPSQLEQRDRLREELVELEARMSDPNAVNG